MTNYPESIYEPRERENRSGVEYDPTKKPVWFKEDADAIENEIVGIETELGTEPKGIWASVKENLEKIWEAIAGFAASFLELTDTPESYEGQAGKAVLVKETEDGLEFGAVAGEGDMLKAVYDTDDDGVVDNSEKLEGSTKAQVQDHAPKAHGHTPAEVGLGNVTDDAQLKRAAADFNSFAEKAAPINADILLIEDSAAAYAKKKVTKSSLLAGVGGTLLDSSVSEVEVKNTTTETTIYSVTIPAGLLGTNKGVRVKIPSWLWRYSDATDRTTILRFKYGGTTLVTLTILIKGGTIEVSFYGDIEILLFGAGATNSQKGSMWCALGDGVIARVELTGLMTKAVHGGVGTSAINSTANQTLLVSVQHSYATSTFSFKKLMAITEKII